MYYLVLNRRLDNGESFIANNGYNDETTLRCSVSAPEVFVGNQKAVRGRHENINSRLKRWRVLTVPFRHDRNLHGPASTPWQASPS